MSSAGDEIKSSRTTSRRRDRETAKTIIPRSPSALASVFGSDTPRLPVRRGITHDEALVSGRLPLVAHSVVASIGTHCLRHSCNLL